MNIRRFISVAVCIAGLFGLTASAQDKIIDNGRLVVGLDDFSWNNTHVGKYTSGNELFLQGIYTPTYTNPVNLNVASLTIGSSRNTNNEVLVRSDGALNISGKLTINGSTNNNVLLVGERGTLSIGSDFDFTLPGVTFSNGAILKVGGELSNLDAVEGGLKLHLTGSSSSWDLGTNELAIGATSSSNAVFIENGAKLEIDRLRVGSGTTVSNDFIVSDSSTLLVRDGIDLWDDNNLTISNATLAIDFDFNGSEGVRIVDNGTLEARADLAIAGIDGGGNVILNGSDATWTNLTGSALVIGDSSDKNSLQITNGATVRAQTFTLGSSSNVNNTIRITDGGTLILEAGGSIVNETNKFEVVDQGKLVLESNYGIGGTINWHDGGIVEARAAAPYFTSAIFNDKYREDGALFLNYGKTLILSGSNANWNITAENLHIGDVTSGNSLILTNEAIANFNSVSIGDFVEGGGNNTLSMHWGMLTSQTYIAIGGTLDGDDWIHGSGGNTVLVDDSILYAVGDLHHRNSSNENTLTIGVNSTVDVENYEQSAMARLNFLTDTNAAQTGRLNVRSNANFHAGARIGVDAVARLSMSETNNILLLSSSRLIVGGVTNATTDDLDALETINGSLVHFNLRADTTNLYADISRVNIADSAGINPEGMLGQISQAIDELSNSNLVAAAQVDIINGLNSNQVHNAMRQLYAYNIPTYTHLRSLQGGIDQILLRNARTPYPKQKPKSRIRRSRLRGARGPEQDDEKWEAWLKVHGTYGVFDTDGSGQSFNDGFDLQRYGTVLGIDRSFENWRIGLGGGISTTLIEGDNGDESDAFTAYGLLYAGYTAEDWFGDFVLALGSSRIDNESGGFFDVSSDTDASQLAIYLGAGTEIEHPENAALLRPEIALQFSRFGQDDYTEDSNNALGKIVDDFDRWDIQSSIGGALLIPHTGKKTEQEAAFRVFWLHEFNDEEENIDYTLVATGTEGRFTMRGPESDIIQLGLGYLIGWENDIKLRLDLDGLFGENHQSSTLAATLQYSF